MAECQGQWLHPDRCLVGKGREGQGRAGEGRRGELAAWTRQQLSLELEMAFAGLEEGGRGVGKGDTKEGVKHLLPVSYSFLTCSSRISVNLLLATEGGCWGLCGVSP